jgi:hypothetical protein
MSALRQLKRRIKEIEYSYSEKRRQLEQENAASEKFQQLEFSMVSAIQEIENQIDWIESNRLSRKARSLDVVVPPLSDAGMWRREEFGPKIWLTQEGRAHVRNLIHEERKRRFEDMSRWIPLLSVILAIIGTLTSLVALTLQRKSADAATMAAGNTRIALETAANQLEAWKNSQSAQLVVEKFDAKLIPMRTYVFGQTITNPKELEIQVVLTIKNVGPSVAKEIFITKNGGSFDAKTVPIQYPQWRWHPPMPFVGGRSLTAGESFMYRPELPAADVDGISPAGSKRIYFTIGINYRDMFERPHVITECKYWVATIYNARWTGCDWTPSPPKP